MSNPYAPRFGTGIHLLQLLVCPASVKATQLLGAVGTASALSSQILVGLGACRCPGESARCLRRTPTQGV